MQIHGDAVRLGVHSGQQSANIAEELELWRRAEELDYDWVSNFDHFRPPDGGPGGPCFEGLTLLGALAARTSRVRCGILVVAACYRHPAVLASIAATLDHVSGGRLELGVGAGGPDLATAQYALPSPPLRVRLEILAETCVVLRSLWTQESTTFEGRHFRLRDAHLEPKPLQERLPLVVGGAGERHTLRIVAEHADVWNTFAGDLDAYRRKVDVLAAHCADVGRPAKAIRRSLLFRAVLDDDERAAQERLEELLPGVSPDAPARRMTFAGTPEQCVEHLRAYARLGVRDFLLGVRRPVDWQTVELVGRQVAPALRA